MASGSAIARMAKDRLRKGGSSIILDEEKLAIEDITAEIVGKGARHGDKLCGEVINTAAYYLGIGLGNVVNMLNPEMIVIGGGVSAMGNMILNPARKSMKAHAFKLPASKVRVVRAKLGFDSGLYGAAIYSRLRLGGIT
jgi:glucokinase